MYFTFFPPSVVTVLHRGLDTFFLKKMALFPETRQED